ncbi:MAG: hypothetical protein RIE56_14070, partial [Amphiplicatus sp.]
ARICALPAFWVGLLYDETALAAAWDVAKGWTREEREALRVDAAHYGLKATIGKRTVQDVAKELLAVSREGLRRRAKAGKRDADETGFLDTFCEIAESGVTQGEITAARFLGDLKGDVGQLLAEASY